MILLSIRSDLFKILEIKSLEASVTVSLFSNSANTPLLILVKLSIKLFALSAISFWLLISCNCFATVSLEIVCSCPEASVYITSLPKKSCFTYVKPKASAHSLASSLLAPSIRSKLPKLFLSTIVS